MTNKLVYFSFRHSSQDDREDLILPNYSLDILIIHHEAPNRSVIALRKAVLQVASLDWGLKKGRQSVESVGCHGSTQNPSCSAFPAPSPLQRPSAPSLLS